MGKASDAEASLKLAEQLEEQAAINAAAEAAAQTTSS